MIGQTLDGIILSKSQGETQMALCTVHMCQMLNEFKTLFHIKIRLV